MLLVNSGWAVWCGAGQRLSQVFRFLHSCRIFAWASTCLGSICAKISLDMVCARLCLQCVRRSKPGAFHVIALCCNSFCMPASSSHGRSILFPLGNENYEFVAIGNLLASRMTLLMFYSLAKKCRFLLEQPGGSALPLHPRVSSFFERHYVWNASIWGGVYADVLSEATPKRHTLWSNDFHLLQRLHWTAGYMSKSDMQNLTGERLCKKQKTANGEWWSGDKETLKKSQWGTQCLVNDRSM